MNTWDVIIIGGGIIGLSLSIELRKRGSSVLLVERGEPGREASHAAAGMLTECMLETPQALQAMAKASAGMYPEFVHELQDESGINVDLRAQGTLLFVPRSHVFDGLNAERLSPAQLAQYEPAVSSSGLVAFFVKERSVDPRALADAALKAAKHREVEIASGAAVTGLLMAEGKVSGVRTDKTTYHAPTVVNCAGAWAGEIAGDRFPTRPVKGQMLCVVGPTLQHVLRAPSVYLVPRSDGRILIGATVENAG